MGSGRVAQSVVGRARKIRLLLLDADGVLSNGMVYMDGQGRETQAFHIHDGHGLVMLQRAGVGVSIITGRTSAAVAQRAKDLGIKTVYQGVGEKAVIFDRLLAAHRLTAAEVAFMGDDLIDLTLLDLVGLAIAPANAVEAVKRRVHWITRRPGGAGAVREVTDLLLQAQGKWPTLGKRRPGR